MVPPHEQVQFHGDRARLRDRREVRRLPQVPRHPGVRLRGGRGRGIGVGVGVGDEAVGGVDGDESNVAAHLVHHLEPQRTVTGSRSGQGEIDKRENTLLVT